VNVHFDIYCTVNSDTLHQFLGFWRNYEKDINNMQRQ